MLRISLQNIIGILFDRNIWVVIIPYTCEAWSVDKMYNTEVLRTISAGNRTCTFCKWNGNNNCSWRAINTVMVRCQNEKTLQKTSRRLITQLISQCPQFYNFRSCFTFSCNLIFFSYNFERRKGTKNGTIDIFENFKLFDY